MRNADCQLPATVRIYAGMELEFLSAGTVAKFIIKSPCLLLLLNCVFSAETTDGNIFYCSLLARQPCLHKCDVSSIQIIESSILTPS